jgi:hypothetical protein
LVFEFWVQGLGRVVGGLRREGVRERKEGRGKRLMVGYIILGF